MLKRERRDEERRGKVGLKEKRSGIDVKEKVER